MHIENFKREILSIPNLLSMFRLVLIPVYTSIYLNARDTSDYFLAAAILAVSCLTDLIDGKVARHFNMITNLGKLLDPLADKLTQFALILCLAVRHPVLWYLVGLFFVKELFQLIACAISLSKGLTMTGSLLPGKISTTVLFISLILLVMFPNVPDNVIAIFVVINSICLIFAFSRYAYAFLSKKAKRKLFIEEDPK